MADETDLVLKYLDLVGVDPLERTTERVFTGVVQENILVQLELHGEVGDQPAVSSNSFLTFAKKNYGLDPPD